MNYTAILEIVLIALKLFQHFINMDEEEFNKSELPENTKSRLSVIRAKTKAINKYVKDNNHE